MVPYVSNGICIQLCIMALKKQSYFYKNICNKKMQVVLLSKYERVKSSFNIDMYLCIIDICFPFKKRMYYYNGILYKFFKKYQTQSNSQKPSLVYKAVYRQSTKIRIWGEGFFTLQMLHPPGFYYVKKPKRFVILSSDKSSERNLSCFFK